MRFIPTKIKDVWVIEPKVFGDRRGFFFESFSQALFKKNGIREPFIQDNHSRSAKGVLRGLHYQIAPRAQAKIVRVVRGAAFDVAVDLRKNSKTYGRYVAEVLSEENRKMMFIPKGFAHGFLALEPGTEFLYKCSDVYSPAHERGILWNDRTLGIRWPKLSVPYRLSDKDTKYPAFAAHRHA